MPIKFLVMSTIVLTKESFLQAINEGYVKNRKHPAVKAGIAPGTLLEKFNISETACKTAFNKNKDLREAYAKQTREYQVKLGITKGGKADEIVWGDEEVTDLPSEEATEEVAENW